MTYQQLIKKLRWGWRFVEGQDISNRDLEQAATSIEELVEERDTAHRLLGAATQMQTETQAKLTKAVEALRFYAPTKRQLGERWFIQNFGGRDDGELAAATLAELEGKE